MTIEVRFFILLIVASHDNITMVSFATRIDIENAYIIKKAEISLYSAETAFDIQ